MFRPTPRAPRGKAKRATSARVTNAHTRAQPDLVLCIEAFCAHAELAAATVARWEGCFRNWPCSWAAWRCCMQSSRQCTVRRAWDRGRRAGPSHLRLADKQFMKLTGHEMEAYHVPIDVSTCTASSAGATLTVHAQVVAEVGIAFVVCLAGLLWSTPSFLPVSATDPAHPRCACAAACVGAMAGCSRVTRVPAQRWTSGRLGQASTCSTIARAACDCASRACSRAPLQMTSLSNARNRLPLQRAARAAALVAGWHCCGH